MFAVMPAPFQGGGTGPTTGQHSEYKTPSMFRASRGSPRAVESNRDSKGQLFDDSNAPGVAYQNSALKQQIVTSDQVIPEQTEESNHNVNGEMPWA